MTAPEPDPCQCHDSWAYISPTHRGHCCFVPATQTCHQAEVAAWEAERDCRAAHRAEPVSSGSGRSIEDMIEASSLGTPAAKAARATVPPEVAQAIVARSKQVRQHCYCGCCGREIGAGTRTDPEWCADCKPHLRCGPLFAPWQRTYFAQHGKDCAWQVDA